MGSIVNTFVVCDDLEYLRNQFADRLDAHNLQDWDAPLLVAAIALMDMHFADRAAKTSPTLAPVLE